MEATLATHGSLKRLFQNILEHWAMDCERVARDKYGSWIYYGSLEKNKHNDGRLRWYRIDVDSQELKVIRKHSDYLTPTTIIYMDASWSIRNINTGKVGYLYFYPYIKSRGKNKGQPNYAYLPQNYSKSKNIIMAD